MQRLGKNVGGYYGDRIDIGALLGEIKVAAQEHGWSSETFHRMPVDVSAFSHSPPKQGERSLSEKQDASSPRPSPPLGGEKEVLRRVGGETESLDLIALSRPASLSTDHAPRFYISTGVHGDEPAGPLAALRLIRENHWPDDAEIILLPCLNPVGFANNKRENAQGIDLNRDYLQSQSPEVRAHIAWLANQTAFDLCLCLHEDWESHGFYVYELNPDGNPSLAEDMVKAAARVCPIDASEVIEGREARGGIIRPSPDPHTRPLWPESFWLLQNKTRHSYTLEAPSDFELGGRVNALVAATRAAVFAATSGSPQNRNSNHRPRE